MPARRPLPADAASSLGRKRRDADNASTKQVTRRPNMAHTPYENGLGFIGPMALEEDLGCTRNTARKLIFSTERAVEDATCPCCGRIMQGCWLPADAAADLLSDPTLDVRFKPAEGKRLIDRLCRPKQAASIPQPSGGDPELEALAKKAKTRARLAGRGREERLASALALAAESDAAAARLEWLERAVAELPDEDPEALAAKVAELKKALGYA